MPPSPRFTEAAERHCRERLLSCLGVLNTHVTVVKQGRSILRPQCTVLFTRVTGEHTHKETGVASDGEFWISKTLATIALLDNEDKHVTPLIDVDGEVEDLLDKIDNGIDLLSEV